MKKLMLVLLCNLLVSYAAIAQNCSEFVNKANGKKLSYVSQDAKGKTQMTVVYLTTKKDASTVAVHATINDKDGKNIGSGDSQMICTGNAIKMDMKSFIPASTMKQYGNMQANGEAKYLTYPNDLKPGQSLDDGSLTMSLNNGGAAMGDLQMDIINRKVEAAEVVNTKAGNFNCLKITYDVSTKIKMMGIGIPFKMKVIEWYSPELGRFVKSESYNKNDKLMGTMTLDSLN